jgi:hypothetical protein
MTRFSRAPQSVRHGAPAGTAGGESQTGWGSCLKTTPGGPRGTPARARVNPTETQPQTPWPLGRAPGTNPAAKEFARDLTTSGPKVPPGPVSRPQSVAQVPDENLSKAQHFREGGPQ